MTIQIGPHKWFVFSETRLNFVGDLNIHITYEEDQKHYKLWTGSIRLGMYGSVESASMDVYSKFSEYLEKTKNTLDRTLG